MSSACGCCQINAVSYMFQQVNLTELRVFPSPVRQGFGLPLILFVPMSRSSCPMSSLLLWCVGSQSRCTVFCLTVIRCRGVPPDEQGVVCPSKQRPVHRQARAVPEWSVDSGSTAGQSFRLQSVVQLLLKEAAWAVPRLDSNISYAEAGLRCRILIASGKACDMEWHCP